MTIKVESVTFSYESGFTALRDVSLEVVEGDFVALMGENGAGKTTLVKHFNGLLKPSSGRVLVDGVETASQSVATLSQVVGIVFQNPDHQLFCENVEKEVSFALKNFRFSPQAVKERVDWALKLLNIEKYRHTSPLILSRGEKKRVAMGCVLAWNPKYLVIDEPTIGQDYGQKEKLRGFLRDLTRQGKTVIIVTHDVEFVVECLCKVVLMSAGSIIAQGSAKQVLTDVELVKRGGLLLPQVTEVFRSLEDLGFPGSVLDVPEAVEFIQAGFRRSKNDKVLQQI